MPDSNAQTESETEFTEIQEVRIRWSGPLPPPGALRELEELEPGSTSRVLRMAEIQQQHEIELDRLRVPAEIRANDTGLWLGGISILAALAVAGMAIWKGAAYAAIPIVIAVAAAVTPAAIQTIRQLLPPKNEKIEERPSPRVDDPT